MLTKWTLRGSVPLALLLGLTLAATALVATPTGAVAATRTTITGWSTSPVTVAPRTEVGRTVTVLTGGRTVERRVILQFRPAGQRTWEALATARTDRRGVAALVAPAVPRTGWLRAKVPSTRTAAGARTARQAVTVDPPSDPPSAPQPGTPTAFEAEVLRLTNVLRAQGTTCGDRELPPKPALEPSPELTVASRDYAERMGREGFFAHVSPNGDDPGDRMTAAGYAWRGYGENIAAGQRSPAAVVEAWRTSVGHCQNMMGNHVHLGVGHADVAGSRYGDYWVQLFGVPR